MTAPRVVAWGFLTTGVAGTIWAGAVDPVHTVDRAPAVEQPHAPGRQRPPSRADSLISLAGGRAVFRATRRPASVAFDPGRPGEATLAASPAPRPVLSLVGIVSGAEPTAVVEGFPGVDGGRVVRAGEVIGTFRVLAITGDRVRIAGLDTVWVLSVREPWR